MISLYAEKPLIERMNMLLEKLPDAIPFMLTIMASVLLLVHDALEETKQLVAILGILIGIALQLAKFFRDRHLRKEIEEIKAAREIRKEEFDSRLVEIEKKLSGSADD